MDDSNGKRKVKIHILDLFVSHTIIELVEQLMGTEYIFLLTAYKALLANMLEMMAFTFQKSVLPKKRNQVTFKSVFNVNKRKLQMHQMHS